jgi:5-methylcytosine-specific restriction endonuclease McrA
MQGIKPKGICRFCAGKCPGRKTNWCSDACVTQYLIACNDPKTIDAMVYERDHGVCHSCGIDLEVFLQDLSRIPLDRIASNTWRLKGFVPEAKLEAFTPTLGGVKALLEQIYQSRLWQVHHVLPVSEGGGLCPLEGFQTLCLACHKRIHKNGTTRNNKRSLQ